MYDSNQNMSDSNLPALFDPLKEISTLIESISNVTSSVVACIISVANGTLITNLLIDDFLRNLQNSSTFAILDCYRKEFREFILKKITVLQRDDAETVKIDTLQTVSHAIVQPKQLLSTCSDVMIRSEYPKTRKKFK